ncbi:hypothetical protein LIER_34874 [Lithospermum erythrorhizon]|uniref:Uncharacterized protein n=1 Tax=Lithospermum erythrorhizon TaxID=34254 RepID=A0AAV3S4L9_LITER
MDITSSSSQRPSSIPQDNLAPALSESVPQRPDSSILVIELETLGFYRLHTAIGAEVIVGDLKFTPTHDPFTNMAIPQDVARIRHPETVPANPYSTPSATPAAPPSTHGADASQTGAPVVNTCDPPPDVPTIIRDSLHVPFPLKI